MENVNVFPEVYKHRVNSKGEVSVVLTITLNRKKVASEKLHKKVVLTDWDEDKKQSYSNDLLNQFIKERKQAIEQEILTAQLLKKPITLEFLCRLVNGFKITFQEYATELLEKKRLKDGRPYDPESKRRYKDEIARVKEYSPSLLLPQITVEFLNNYKLWMQTVYLKKDGKKLHENSIWKALSFIRSVCKEAIKEGLMKDYPFNEFNCGKCVTDITKIKYLELPELKALEHALNTIPMQQMTMAVGWRFLVMCVFGMRISDAMKLDNAFINDAGQMEYKPYKTRHSGNIAIIPIVSERQRDYLNRSLQNPLPNLDHKIFRRLFNEHLQILAAHAKIKIHLTSHVGRHTMGSFTVDAGIEESSAMKILGVKSVNTIKVYRHLKESKLIAEANKLNNIF